METEIGGICPQARESLQLPELRRKETESPLEPPEGAEPCLMQPWFQLSEMYLNFWENMNYERECTSIVLSHQMCDILLLWQ